MKFANSTDKILMGIIVTTILSGRVLEGVIEAIAESDLDDAEICTIESKIWGFVLEIGNGRTREWWESLSALSTVVNDSLPGKCGQFNEYVKEIVKICGAVEVDEDTHCGAEGTAHYKYKIGDIVAVKDRLYLGDARIEARMNGMYLLTFASPHGGLMTVTWPSCGKAVERAMLATEEQIQRMQMHDPEKQIWDNPLEAALWDRGKKRRSCDGKIMKQE